MDTDLTSEAQSCASEMDSHDRRKPTTKPSLNRKEPARLKNIKLADLPPPGVSRWVIRRKAQLVAAVEAGIITLDDALGRYSVSPEEFESWQRALRRHGIYGLRTTRSQIYRVEKDGNRRDKS
jgi:hypothetical protein